MFAIKSYTKHEFYTCYKINFKGKTYVCNYNGGLPKLEGVRLSERLRCQLDDIIENFFLNVICK